MPSLESDVTESHAVRHVGFRSENSSGPDASRSFTPSTHEDKYWHLTLGTGSSMTWSTPPASLRGLLQELFEAKPGDPLEWIHYALWHHRTQELLGRAHPKEELADASECMRVSERSSYAASIDRRSSHEARIHGRPHHLDAPDIVVSAVSSMQSDNTLVSPLPAGILRNPANQRKMSIMSSMSASRSGRTDSDPQELYLPQHFMVPNPKRPSRALYESRGSDQTASLSNFGGSNFSVRPSSEPAVSSQAMPTTSSADTSGFKRYFGKQDKKMLGSRISERPNELGSQASFDGALENRTPDKCLISPVSPRRISWDLCFFLCLLWDLWATPMELVFFPDFSSYAHDRMEIPFWFRAMSVAVLIFFCADIVLNFFTGFVQDGTIIMQRRRIAVRYLQTWFVFDLVATLPEVIASFGGAFFIMRVSRGMKSYKMVRALRLLRVLRLIRTQGFVNILTMQFEMLPKLRFFLKMAYINFVIVFFIHVHGSIWAAMQPSQWHAANEEEAFGNYFESLWRVAPALTLVGPLPAVNDWQHVLNLLVGLERLTCLVLVGKWLLWRAALLMPAAERAYNMRGALAYLKHHQVAPALQLKVFQNLHEVDYVQRRQHQYVKLENESFPPQLKRLIRYEIWSERLMSLDLIYHLGRWDSEGEGRLGIVGIIGELALRVQEEIFASKVILFSVGESSHTAYLIVRGSLAVTYHEYETDVPDYTAGMWVGEKALVNHELRRIQTMVCKEWCQLMALYAQDFEQILVLYGVKDKFDDLLRAQLNYGLCGRCGVLGDHFNHDCPLLGDALASQSTNRTAAQFKGQKTIKMIGQKTEKMQKKIRNSRRSTSNLENLTTHGNDLKRFLSETNLTKLASVLACYGVQTLNDLKLSTIEQIRADPNVQLSQADCNKLSEASIKEFRKKMRRGKSQVYEVLANSGNENNHLVFISHYKMEAGTEAALMQEDLQKIIQEDVGNPGYSLKSAVFLDSEDLRNLNDLKTHVQRSHNLVLLLTPGVLSRPWCLVEIVTAMEAGVNIVPVEIQRKDFQFSYPDDAFYRRIRAGNQLDAGALRLIHEEGIGDEALEDAIKDVFKHIALPFSPHKTGAIRQAELKDILNQCQLRDDMPEDDLFVSNPGRRASQSPSPTQTVGRMTR